MKSKYHATLFIVWLVSTTLENRPPRIETLRRDRRLQRRRAVFGALRRFSATALWRRVLTALPPALERRLTASPLGSGRGIVGVKLAHPGGPRVSSGTGHRAVGQCRRWVITGFMRWSKRRRAIVLVWERSCLYGNVRATKPALSSRFLVNLAARRIPKPIRVELSQTFRVKLSQTFRVKLSQTFCVKLSQTLYAYTWARRESLDSTFTRGGQLRCNVDRHRHRGTLA